MDRKPTRQTLNQDSKLSVALDALRTHVTNQTSSRAFDLLAADQSRANQLSISLAGILIDLSKHAWDTATFEKLNALADAANLENLIVDLFDGEPINKSEGRAAMHTVLRAHADDLAHVRTREAHAQAAAAQTRVIEIVEQLSQQRRPITDVIHVGIGGSDLGPRLLYQALRANQTPAVRVHFLANLDGHALDRYLTQLDPLSTAVILVSKSFSTQETLLNGSVLKIWLDQSDELAAEKTLTQQNRSRLFAVTANTMAAEKFGIVSDNILPIWEWLGGRYSVWSAVSLSIALAFGKESLSQLQNGARMMDRHFAASAWNQNAPVMMAFASLFNRLRSDSRAHAVVPYDNRLALLPAYLQQLVMESNGKSVRIDSTQVDIVATPTIFGGVGTEVQHAFFQALHQGLDVVPVDFIGVIDAGHTQVAHQRGLLANMLAQSAALLRGRSFAQALGDTDKNLNETERNVLARQRECPGDRPSTVILLKQLDAFSLGALLALYEHQTFVQAALAGINPFDQFGVELGKQIANSLAPALEGHPLPDDCDASTAMLIKKIMN